MKQSNNAAFEAIKNFENMILKTKNVSLSMLQSELQQLRDFRRDVYKTFENDSEPKAFNTSPLFDEYDNHCAFVFELLTTKQLPSTTNLKILTDFLGEYDFIKPFDEKKIAYDSTLRVLDGLSKHPSVAGENAGTYNLKQIYSLTNQFIYNQNKPAEPSQDA